MKKILCLLFILASVSAYADTITLKNGESIYISGTVVKCEGGGGQGTGNAAYADLPWSKLSTLLVAGLGPCKIRYTQGSTPMPFYYSPQFNALHVSSQSYGIIRDDIRSGNCD